VGTFLMMLSLGYVCGLCVNLGVLLKHIYIKFDFSTQWKKQYVWTLVLCLSVLLCSLAPIFSLAFAYSSHSYVGILVFLSGLLLGAMVSFAIAHFLTSVPNHPGESLD
jgi:hypothetical protein